MRYQVHCRMSEGNYQQHTIKNEFKQKHRTEHNEFIRFNLPASHILFTHSILLISSKFLIHMVLFDHHVV